MSLLPVLVLSGLSATAHPEISTAEVGQEVLVEVSASGADLTNAKVEPPVLPEGMESGHVLGPKLTRPVTPRGAVQTRDEVLIWTFPLIPTRSGTFRVPPFVISIGSQRASTPPFEIRATGAFDPGRYAFVETRVDPRPRWAGEPIEVTLVAGIGADWTDRLVKDETLLGAPWLEGLGPGCLAEPEPTEPAGVSMRTPNGTLAMQPGGETRHAGKFTTWTTVRRFLPTRPGTVMIGPTTFRAVIATRIEHDLLFRDHFFASQTKLASVSAAPVSIGVRALPEAGRPDDFSGLVGRLALAVEAEPSTVRVGESVRVRVVVTGRGNLSSTPLPRVEPSGFKRFGVTEEVDPSGEARTLVYDLAPASPEIEAVPPFRIPYFDTAAGRYAVLASSPLRIKVLPGGSVSTLADLPPRPPDRSIAAPEPKALLMRFLQGPGGMVVMAAGIGVPLIAGTVALLRSRRRARPAKNRRRASARAKFRSSLNKAAREEDPRRGCLAVATALGHYLADLGEVPPESFLGADLDHTLAAYLPESDLRARVARLVFQAERGAFGDDRTQLPAALAQEARELAGPLEEAFRKETR